MGDDNSPTRSDGGQFRKGVSGNPKGRPCGAKGMKTIVHQAASRKVSMTVGGRRKKVAAIEAIIATMMAEALRGDRHARQEFLRLCQQHAVGDFEQIAKALSDSEQEIMAGILGRAVSGPENDDGK